MKIQSPFGHTKVFSSWTGILLATLLMLPGSAWSHGGGGKNVRGDENEEKVEMASSAKITIHEAIKAATNKVPGTVIEAELEEKPRVTWEVEVVTDQGKVMEVLVDIDTGAVVGVKEAESEKDRGQKKKGKMEKCGGMKDMMRKHEGMSGMMQKGNGAGSMRQKKSGRD